MTLVCYWQAYFMYEYMIIYFRCTWDLLYRNVTSVRTQWTARRKENEKVLGEVGEMRQVITKVRETTTQTQRTRSTAGQAIELIMATRKIDGLGDRGTWREKPLDGLTKWQGQRSEQGLYSELGTEIYRKALSSTPLGKGIRQIDVRHSGVFKCLNCTEMIQVYELYESLCLRKSG